MASLTRSTIVWLLALVMPFQVLTAVYLDVRGPAHFHVGNHDNDHDHDRALAREHGHVHAHSHGRHHVERHHHHPDDLSVVAVRDGGLPETLALKEENPSGWSGTMLVALLASGASPQLPEMASALTPQPELPLQTRSLGRLERPPRINPA